MIIALIRVHEVRIVSDIAGSASFPILYAAIGRDAGIIELTAIAGVPPDDTIAYRALAASDSPGIPGDRVVLNRALAKAKPASHIVSDDVVEDGTIAPIQPAARPACRVS
jgi:ABC-type amino acid transport substrate-binding protein